MSDTVRSPQDISAGLAALIVPQPIKEPVEDVAIETDPDLEVAQPVDEQDPEATEEDGEETSPTGSEPLWTGTVDGQEVTVTDQAELDQAVNLGLVFGKRNRELRDEQREFEEQRQRVSQELSGLRQDYVQKVEIAQRFLANPAGERPARTDFESVEQYDQALQGWEAQVQLSNELAKEIEAERTALQAEHDKRLRQFLEDAEDQTKALIPEWSDPKVRADEGAKIEEYVAKLGLTPEIVQRHPLAFHEPVLRVLARQAWLYSQASEAGKEKVQAAKTKASAPGAGGETDKSMRGKRYRETRNAVRERGGKVDDMAPLMGAFLERQAQTK